MAIVFSGLAFSGVINDLTNYYYTDRALNRRIGMGEKYAIEVRGWNIQAGPKVKVNLESSNDNVNWTVRSTLTSGNSLSTTGVFAQEDGTADVGGRFARFAIRLSTSGSAYVELWVTARQAA